MKKWMVLLGLASLFLCSSVSASATTYYVDYANGNDANAGTSTAAPWQHAPGMNGCSGTCASITPVAGDRIILKGGVTWDASNFTWSIDWTGTPSNPIRIGVDRAWHTGGSWTRPIFDGGGRIGAFINLYNGGTMASYVIIDNIEFKGLYWAGGTGGASYVNFYQSDHNTVEHCFFHAWVHPTSGLATTSQIDNCTLLGGYAGGTHGTYDQVSYNVFDGSDSTGRGDSCVAVRYLPNADHNVVVHMPNAFVATNNSGGSGIHDNFVGPINLDVQNAHENCIETGIGGTGSALIYNNVLYDCLGVAVKVNQSYVWNNLIYSDRGAPIAIQLDSTSAPSSNKSWAYVYNNTMDMRATSSPCMRIVDRSHGAYQELEYRNNFCIYGSGGTLALGPGATTLIDIPNSNMRGADATAAGISSSQTPYIDAPTDSTCAGKSGCPVAAGANLSSLATGSLAALASDTTYGCTVGAGNVANCPARPSLSRPGSGTAWDSGTYTFSSATATQSSGPEAPTGLIAISQ